MNGNGVESSTARLLGRTGLRVGRLGVSASYGAPAAAFLEAFARGCNYFYCGWRKNGEMAQAVRRIVREHGRERLVITLQSYGRYGVWVGWHVRRQLRDMGLDYADILLMGWHNSPPSRPLLDAAKRLRDRGLVRHLAVSGHNRKLFPVLERDGLYDVFHIRYNAAHRGAEEEAFAQLAVPGGPGIVTYTATSWGTMLKPRLLPPGETPVRARDCYRFVFHHPAVHVCMAGPGNLEQMREALAALDEGPLGPEELDRMRRIGDHVRRVSRRRF